MSTELGSSTRGASTTRVGDTVTRTARVGRIESSLLALQAASGRLGTMTAATVAWLRETVTPMGWVLAIVLVLGLVAGLAFGIVEALVVAAIAFALIALSVPFLIGGATYDVEFSIDRDRVVAGSDVGARITVRNASRGVSLPSVLDIPVGPGLVEAFIPLLTRGSTHDETITIAAPRRGVITIGPMTVTRGDPVGVLKRDMSWPQVETVYVHPVTTPLPPSSAGFVKDVEGQPTRNIVDSDLAFHAIREYMPGDSRRHVHWKSTAKTGTLMVRQFEESRRARIAVVLDVLASEYETEEEFELAVSAAASLALQAVRDDREVLMVTSGMSELRRGEMISITSLPTRTPKTLLDATSSIAIDERAQRLESVTTLTAQTFPELSIAFLVTGSQVTVDRLRRAAFAFPANATTVVVRVEPGAEPTLRATRDFSVLTIGVLGDLKHLIARGALG